MSTTSHSEVFSVSYLYPDIDSDYTGILCSAYLSSRKALFHLVIKHLLFALLKDKFSSVICQVVCVM